MGRKGYILMLLAGILALTAAAPIVWAQQSEQEKTTLQNLMTAYNGESNARAKYLEFAKKADEEGYGPAASLFRAAAEAERIHLGRHAAIITAMGSTPQADIQPAEVKTTAENLKAAFDGETYENQTMYPEFLKQAEGAGNKEAVDAFEDAGAAEGVHAGWYKKALDNINTWKGASKQFSVCPRCGNVIDTAPWTICPICKTGKEKFISVS